MIVAVVLVRTTNGTDTGGSSSLSFEGWLTQYWYVLLIVLAVLVVVCVLVCACVLRKHPRSSSPLQSHGPNHKAPNYLEEHGGSSDHQSSLPTMPSGSISADSTPIPSPHSSQRSVQVPSSLGGGGGNGSGRSRRTSPHLSSNSSDTLRPGAHSVSSNSSSPSVMVGQNGSPTRQQERQSPMERQGSLQRRPRSSPIVRVTSMPDVKNPGGSLRTAPSTVSVESSSSGRSGVSYRFQPASDSDAVVEVGVTVHTPGDPDKAVRIATAAALAESARKLAQEAASFIDEEMSPPTAPPPHIHSSIQYHPKMTYTNGPNRINSGRSSSIAFSHQMYPINQRRSASLATPSLEHQPISSSRLDPGRGEYSSLPRTQHHYSSQVSGLSRGGSQFNDSDYHSYHASQTLDSNPSIPQYMDPDPNFNQSHHPRTCAAMSPRGEPYPSTTINYMHEYIPPRKHSLTEEHGYRHTNHRRNSENSLPFRKPSHLSGPGRRDGSPMVNSSLRKKSQLDMLRSEKKLTIPVSLPDAPNVVITRLPDIKEPKSSETTVRVDTLKVVDTSLMEANIPHSPSNSTGLSSTHTENSSQHEDPSPNPSQEHLQSNDASTLRSPIQSKLSSDSHTSSSQKSSEPSSTELVNQIEPQTETETEKQSVTQTETRTETNPSKRHNKRDHDFSLGDKAQEEIELTPLSTVIQPDTDDMLTLSKHQTNPVSDISVQSRRLQRDETQSSIESEESIEVPTPQVLPLVDDVFRLHTAGPLPTKSHSVLTNEITTSHLRAHDNRYRRVDHVRSLSNGNQLSFSPRSSYKLNRIPTDVGLMERPSSYRQSSLTRITRPYSPPGDRLSLSRQSYQIPSRLPSTFGSPHTLIHPSSVDVTVDV